MTPRELCDLAAKINSAVPGLVPDFQQGMTGIHHVNRLFETHEAAAMMLGRVWTWMENESCDMEIVKCRSDLEKYVATTLPGANA